MNLLLLENRDWRTGKKFYPHEFSTGLNFIQACFLKIPKFPHSQNIRVSIQKKKFYPIFIQNKSTKKIIHTY